MTDRRNALTIIFDSPIRDDDLQPYIEALRLLRGVIEVIPSSPHGLASEYITEMQVRHDLRKKMWDVLREESL